MPAFDLQGKVALVTGANRGIGKAIAETLIQKGIGKLYAAVRDPASVSRLADGNPKTVVALQLDLSQPETIAAAAKMASDVELVINNAGVLKVAGVLSDNAIDDFQSELTVNVFGLIRMAQAFGPVLKRNGGGAFVQLNSVASLKSFPQFSTYCASKAAAYSLTQAIREEFRQQGTHVLSVHPGPIKTDMGHDAGLDEIAEPPTLVSEGIVTALAAGEFHLFPDTMAKQFGDAYEGFRTSIVEAEMAEA